MLLVPVEGGCNVPARFPSVVCRCKCRVEIGKGRSFTCTQAAAHPFTASTNAFQRRLDTSTTWLVESITLCAAWGINCSTCPKLIRWEWWQRKNICAGNAACKLRRWRDTRKVELCMQYTLLYAPSACM